MGLSSKKEIITAVLIGLTTGIFFSYYFLFFKKQEGKKEGGKASTPPTITPKESDKKEKVRHLSIEFPPGNIIVNKPKIEITGKAPVNSLIFILTEAEEMVVENKNLENFSREINLINGENQINIAALLKNGAEEILSLTIIYQEL